MLYPPTYTPPEDDYELDAEIIDYYATLEYEAFNENELEKTS